MKRILVATLMTLGFASAVSADDSGLDKIGSAYADAAAQVGAHRAAVSSFQKVDYAADQSGAISFATSNDDLYRTGAVVANVMGPKDDGYRTLSLKIYSVRDGDTIINQLGVLDITDDYSPVQYINVLPRGETTIEMGSGGKHYVVSIAENGDILIKRPGTKRGQFQVLSTSLSELYELRNRQILSGSPVTIEGWRYYPLAQGGHRINAMLFSEREFSGRMDAAAHPDLMGTIFKTASDGSPVQVYGRIDMGSLQDGSRYHLEWDGSSAWNLVAGAGDPN